MLLKHLNIISLCVNLFWSSTHFFWDRVNTFPESEASQMYSRVNTLTIYVSLWVQKWSIFSIFEQKDRLPEELSALFKAILFSIRVHRAILYKRFIRFMRLYLSSEDWKQVTMFMKTNLAICLYLLSNLSFYLMLKILFRIGAQSDIINCG